MRLAWLSLIPIAVGSARIKRSLRTIGVSDAIICTGIGWSLAGGYEPILDLNVPGYLNARVSLGPHDLSPTVEVNRSYTGVTP